MSDAPKPPFMLDYRHNGIAYSETIWATDWEDAVARVQSIARTGEIVGSDVTTIPANSVTLPFAALWARMLCWWRNL